MKLRSSIALKILAFCLILFTSGFLIFNALSLFLVSWDTPSNQTTDLNNYFLTRQYLEGEVSQIETLVNLPVLDLACQQAKISQADLDTLKARYQEQFLDLNPSLNQEDLTQIYQLLAIAQKDRQQNLLAVFDFSELLPDKESMDKLAKASTDHPAFDIQLANKDKAYTLRAGKLTENPSAANGEIQRPVYGFAHQQAESREVDKVWSQIQNLQAVHQEKVQGKLNFASQEKIQLQAEDLYLFAPDLYDLAEFAGQFKSLEGPVDLETAAGDLARMDQVDPLQSFVDRLNNKLVSQDDFHISLTLNNQALASDKNIQTIKRTLDRNLAYNNQFASNLFYNLGALLILLVSVIYLCLALGWQQDPTAALGYRLSKLRCQHFPADLLFWLLFAALPLLFVGVGTTSSLHEINDPTFLMGSFGFPLTPLIITALLVTFLAMALILACLIIIQVKNRIFLSSLLIVRLSKIIIELSRKLIRKIKHLANYPAITVAGTTCILVILILQATIRSPLFLLVWDSLILAFFIKFFIDLKKLEEAAQAIAQGDLDYQIDTSHMLGRFSWFGNNLNNVRLGAQRAAQQSLRDERLKTELITNVSHDIKTPLTAIISYVDLLSKLDLDNAQAQDYLEVLQKQTEKLRKLTEDILEASKVSTGNLKPDYQLIDLCQLAGQALGEYKDRIQDQGILLVQDIPDQPCWINTDGKLLWRIFDNLLGNVCKYTQPGTRFYFSLTRRPSQDPKLNPFVSQQEVSLVTREDIIVSWRNISRDQLNISPEELRERFIQGDPSRSTDGSGLGLSIASGLAKLLGAELEIAIDGDLFTAQLIFRNHITID